MNNDENTKTILLVEDEAIISIIAAKALKGFGYEVVTVNSGEKAVELAAAGNPVSLVLMDIDLGDKMDGTEAARQILALRDIPIVFHTSHSEREMVERVKGITRYGYVIKSSGNFVLQSSIEMAFELFEANRTIENSMNAMQESEEKYRAAFMTSPDSVNINTMDGRYVDINEGFIKLTGFSREDVIGVLSTEINIWAKPEDRIKLIKGLRESGSVVNLESLFRCKDGSFKTALMSARIIRIKNEPHILSITRDISERKQFEEEIKARNKELGELNAELVSALEELEVSNEEFEAINEELTSTNQELQKKEEVIRSEQLFTESILDSLPGMFYLYSYPELRLKRWNKNHETILGFNPSELKDRYIMDWFLPREKEAVLKAVERVMEKGHHMIESLIQTREGTSVPVLMTGVKFESAGKTYLMGVGIDVTDRKHLEDALRESEEKHRMLVENSHDIIYTLSEEGVFLFVSPAWTALLGHPVDQVSGKPFQPFVHPDDIAGCMEWLKKVIETGQRQEGVEYRVQHMNGSWYWHTSSAVPLRDENGKVIGFEGTASDITARKMAENKISRLLAEKEILLKEVHHRIKNNMNTIKGLLILQSYAQNDSAAAAALNDAESRVQSMMVLYDKLYRSDDFRELSLKEYLPVLVEEIAANFPVHESVKIESRVEDFAVDAKTLFPLSILVNEVITNSMKYAFAGRDSGLITVSAAMKDGHAVIVIADDGIGIPESVDVDTSTGFGLSLVNMLTAQIGGSIRVERGNGTRFILEFDL